MRLSNLPALVLVLASSISLDAATAAIAQDRNTEIVVPVHRISVDGVGENIGEIAMRQMDAALEFVVSLASFPPGWHAMHVHESASCEPALLDGRLVAGGAAGRHFDPEGVMDMDSPANTETDEMPVPRDGKARRNDPTVSEAPGQDDPQPPTVPPRQRPRPAGDLPAIHVKEDGSTEYRILTYRLRIDQMPGRSILLHQYGEAPSDPALPRGGGKRIACAVVP